LSKESLLKTPLTPAAHNEETPHAVTRTQKGIAVNNAGRRYPVSPLVDRGVLEEEGDGLAVVSTTASFGELWLV
jgi:hypothetical protein